MTDAKLGAGTRLQLGDGASPEVFTTVSEVLRVSAIGQSVGEIDVTNLDSTSKEYIGSLPDGATVEFDCNWTGSVQQIALRDGVGTTKNFRVIWADGSPATTANFAMVVLGANVGETTPEGQITMNANGRITGDITWT